VDNNITVQYSYGADGQRAVKYSRRGESLYFDSMWSCQTDIPSIRQLKNIFVGQTRIATRLSLQGESSTGYEKVNTYYYHPDHLGSAQLVTDYEGDIYERIEYTPYGETWIERTSDGLELIPFRFTGKELDSETGLYYYGARYLNPRSSMWLSADPALGDYIPVAPVSDEARKHNQNLAGMGGVFNLINLAVYHYAANNPVKYTDPDGRIIAHTMALDLMTNYSNDPKGGQKLGNGKDLVYYMGCYITALGNALGTRDAMRYQGGFGPELSFKRTMAINGDSSLFAAKSSDMIARDTVMNKLFGSGNWDYWTSAKTDLKAKLEEYQASGKRFLIVGVFDLSSLSDKLETHMVGISGLPGEDGVFAADSICPTSSGDGTRLKNPDQASSYCIDNLTEIRVIFLDGDL